MRRASGILLALIAVGCSTTTGLPPPQPPLAVEWPDTPQDAASAPVAASLHWRTMFSDPRLQLLIKTALAENRDLRVALARIEAARAESGIAAADRLPTVSGNFSQIGSRQSADAAGEGNATLSRRYDLSLNVVSYELDLWNRLGSQSEAARSNLLATEAARRGIELGLIGEVADTYFNLIELDERLRLAREIARLHERSLHLISLAHQEGFASNLERLTAEGALTGEHAQIAQLERQRAQAQNKLDLLVGNKPSQLPEGRSIETQEVEYNLAAGLPAEVLLQRPDVIEAEHRLRAARANVDAARAAFLPKILLTAGFGLASGSLATLLGVGQTAWNFQPKLTLPIFDWGRNQGNLDLAEARKDLAVAEYEKTLQSAFREVADLLATRRTLRDQRLAAERQLVINGERLEIMKARQAAGQASQINVYDAGREWLSTRQACNEIRRLQLGNSAMLYKALGGGTATGN